MRFSRGGSITLVMLGSIGFFSPAALADRVSNAKASVYRDGIWDNGAGPVYQYYYNTPNTNPYFEMRNANLTLAQAKAQYNAGTTGFKYYDNNGIQQTYGGANANNMQNHTTNYGWTSNFSIFCNPNNVSVEVHLAFDWSASGLNAAQQTATQNGWESGIEAWWSNRYGINDGTITRPINFDVRFDAYAQAPTYDQTITVLAGNGRADLTHWYALSTGAVEAHEFGHAIGAYDEYWGGAISPGLVTDYSNIMGTVDGLTSGQGLKSTYFADILAWFDANKNPDGTNTIVAVPAPGSMLLLSFGGILAIRRRRA